jgi:hypothetical protein
MTQPRRPRRRQTTPRSWPPSACNPMPQRAPAHRHQRGCRTHSANQIALAIHLPDVVGTALPRALVQHHPADSPLDRRPLAEPTAYALNSATIEPEDNR